MAHRSPTRLPAAFFWALCLALLCSGSAPGQSAPAPSATVLDRVVAVVNDQAILASEVSEEIRLSVLDSGHDSEQELTPARALDHLISRELIRQQMRQEDVKNAAPTDAEIDARLVEIRRDSPACAHRICDSDEKWIAFLVERDLTPDRVRGYLRGRMEILSFIEQRFRQGIRVSAQEVETYYRETLVPRYAPGAEIPPLEKVAPRIEQILLERDVNAIFDDWLRNLRRQGEIEVLDPGMQSADSGDGAGEGTP